MKEFNNVREFVQADAQAFIEKSPLKKIKDKTKPCYKRAVTK